MFLEQESCDSSIEKIQRIFIQITRITYKLGVVAHTFKLRTQDVEAGESGGVHCRSEAVQMTFYCLRDKTSIR